MNTPLMFSSAKDEWSTPQDFYDPLDREFGGFDVDLAASQENTKCEQFYSIADLTSESSTQSESA